MTSAVNNTRFRNYAWGLLAYNVLVVLWGAFVRASKSGDGCGAHWPTCNGEVLPTFEHMKTLIEFTHRGMSGLVLFLVLGLVIWAFRTYPKGHAVRLGSSLSLFFTLTEGLIGAGLVLFKLVAHNDSVPRVIVLSLHLVNTLLLLGSLTLTAWWAGGGARISFKKQGALGFAIVGCLVGVIALAVTGAIAALGDTLFPAQSLAHGLAQDIQPTAHYLLRKRPMHPYTALAVGLYVILIAGLLGHLRPSLDTKRFSKWFITLFLLQMAVGLVNLFMLAPIAMQIVHLLVADALWISLVLLSAAALAVDVRKLEMEEVPNLFPVVEAVPISPVKAPIDVVLEPVAAAVATEMPRATYKDYIALTKPRVISLLLFTTLAAMFIAKGGWPGLGLFLATGLGLYMAAGAANAINMVCERDLDSRMERTSKRPTLTSVSPPNALWFAFGLAIGSFVILWTVANLLAALMALSGLVVYVIVYTLLLKRRTWSNIVIGGAAGAFPPLVGWAAVTNNLSPLAWCLFALIFVWTPVHFWALALLIKDDYAKAGVPMLPVVLGDRNTVIQIGLYALTTVAISVFPVLMHEGGAPGARWLYIGSALLLNGILLWQSLRLYRQPDRPRASSLFHYSMLYLALLFLALALDRSLLSVSI